MQKNSPKDPKNMKTYLDCIPCFFRQAIEASQIANASLLTQKRILDQLGKTLSDFSLNATPPEMGSIIHRLVKEMTGEKDPYKKIKAESNQLALGIYDHLKRKVRHSQDSLLTAVELAIAGNIIDYGVKNSFDIHGELEKILHYENQNIKKADRDFFHYPQFEKRLQAAQTILYIADNAGETVFDRILIEEIHHIHKNKKIIYAVKERPIINDALFEDAKTSGIDGIADIISSGLDAPGTILSQCPPGFSEVFSKADMVISKGQGNFEALSEEKGPIFFLFMAKCHVVAMDLGCQLRDVILLYHDTNPN